MSLHDEFERTGNWLFRWRSYLPFLLFLLLPPAIPLMRRPYGSDDAQNLWEVCCFAISCAGLAVRCVVAGTVPRKTSGRNTSSQIAESLNTTGIYSVVRHPLYLGNYLMWLGIALFCPVSWVAVVFTLCFWLYYERIMYAEEAFLRRKFGAAYEDWSARTPAFLPRLSQWKRSELPFSVRTMISREFTGLFGIAVAFAAMDQFESYIATQRFSTQPMWIVIAACSIAVYLVARFLKKRTDVLQVSGR